MAVAGSVCPAWVTSTLTIRQRNGSTRSSEPGSLSAGKLKIDLERPIELLFLLEFGSLFFELVDVGH